MEGWRDSLSACWNSVAMQLPQLQESLSHLGHSLGLGGFGSDGAGASAVGQEYELRARRLRVVRQLGEGGYSFVYLVRQLAQAAAAAGGPGGGAGGGGLLAGAAQQQLFALKRVLCGSEEQLREAEHEVAVMRRLRHPCLLQLLDAAAQQQRAPDGTTRHVVLMLFPVYDGGNLFDFVLQQRSQQEQQLRAQLATAAARRQAQSRQLAELLRIFLQVCAALHAMHSREPALAHRDVKPQNVLLHRRQQDGQQQAGSVTSRAGTTASAPGSGGSRVAAGTVLYGEMPPLAAPQEDQSPHRQPQQQQQPGGGEANATQGWAEGAWNSGGGSGASAGLDADAGTGRPADAATAAAAAEAAAVIPVESEGQGQVEEQWWTARLAGWRHEWEAVLMDFGSTRPAVVEVRNRAEAMAAQEDAERHCTAPYRAPELWDVASSCTLDERVDVWSLGCLLYFMLCGQSPFERAAGEAGGSLMLAVVNGRLSWPTDAASNVPESIKHLVGRCLDTEPASRPCVADVAAQADRILASLLV